VRPFGLCNRTFDGDMIDPPVIIMTLSLCVKISNETSGDCEDCAVCGESIGLLWRFMDLRWRCRIGFIFDLGIGVVWREVCYLWHWRRICYL
jgi:hypothetical protein